MPNRILKESICTSEDIDSLSAEVEVFFYRLMVVCDDYGLMDARPAIIKAKCYPLKSFDIKRIQPMLDVLAGRGMIELYSVEGKPYLRMANWGKHQQIRSQKPKYPFPTQGEPAKVEPLQAPDSNATTSDSDLKSSDIRCNQPQADAPVIQSNPNPIQSESKSESNPIKPTAVAVVIPEWLSAEVWNSYLAHRKAMKKPMTDHAQRLAFDELEKLLGENHRPEDVINASIRNGWQGLFPPKNNGGKHANGKSRFDVLADTAVGLTGRSRPSGGSARTFEGEATAVD